MIYIATVCYLAPQPSIYAYNLSILTYAFEAILFSTYRQISHCLCSAMAWPLLLGDAPVTSFFEQLLVATGLWAAAVILASG